MSEDTKKQKPEINVKTFNDPGNVLIVVYVMIIIFLLLAGNLANASADRTIKDTTFSKDRLQKLELLIKAE